MAGIWVRLKSIKNVEKQGKLRQFRPGDWVEVGKQTALKWIKEGAAEAKPGQFGPRRPALKYEFSASEFTLFAVPMGFVAGVSIKQNNAVGSWLALEPTPEVVLFGDEHGIAEAAGNWDCLHLPRVQRNEFGTPIVADAFHQMERLLRPGDAACYVNSDIILLQDWADALLKAMVRFDEFLMVGQRWDVNLREPIDFRGDWDKRLRHIVAEHGEVHGVGAIDFFAYRIGTGLYDAVPPFAIGRSAWDNWLVGRALGLGVPVVDVSEVTTVVHQDKRMQANAPVMTEERAKERKSNRKLYDADRDAHGFTGKVNEAPFVMEIDGTITERENRRK